MGYEVGRWSKKNQGFGAENSRKKMKKASSKNWDGARCSRDAKGIVHFSKSELERQRNKHAKALCKIMNKKHRTASDCRPTMVRDSGEKKQRRNQRQKSSGSRDIGVCWVMLGVMGSIVYWHSII